MTERKTGARKPAASKSRARPAAQEQGFYDSVVVVHAQALPPSPARLRGERGVSFAYEPGNAIGYTVIGTARSREAGAPELHAEELRTGAAERIVTVTLYTLSHDPVLSALPRPRLKGILRGAAQTVRQISESRTPPALDWWLALQFSYCGFVTRSAYVSMTVAAGGSVRGIPGAVESNKLFIWQGYIERMTGELVRQIERARTKNPYIDLVRLPRAMKWLQIDNATVGSMILRAAANQLGTGTINAFTGPALRLPPLSESPPKAELAAEIMELYETAEGLSISKLQAAYPSQRPLIGKMCDAGLLIESPEGFVFTQRQLNDHLATLSLHSTMADVPGVGDIKKLTKLPRKDAEQLRLLLLELQAQTAKLNPDA